MHSFEKNIGDLYYNHSWHYLELLEPIKHQNGFYIKQILGNNITYMFLNLIERNLYHDKDFTYGILILDIGNIRTVTNEPMEKDQIIGTVVTIPHYSHITSKQMFQKI